MSRMPGQTLFANTSQHSRAYVRGDCRYHAYNNNAVEVRTSPAVGLALDGGDSADDGSAILGKRCRRSRGAIHSYPVTSLVH